MRNDKASTKVLSDGDLLGFGRPGGKGTDSEQRERRVTAKVGKPASGDVADRSIEMSVE